MKGRRYGGGEEKEEDGMGGGFREQEKIEKWLFCLEDFLAQFFKTFFKATYLTFLNKLLVGMIHFYEAEDLEILKI